MKVLKARKDPKKALLLSLCPGLGFLYLENVFYFIIFGLFTPLPLLFVSTSGGSAIIVSVLLYGLSIYYSYYLANESLKNSMMYKKDPYYMMCLSMALDGLGQLHLKQNKKGYIMLVTGLTSCIVTWIMLISKFGFLDMVLASNERPLYTLTNFMIVWTITALPIKFLSVVDAYYTTYHLYIAKK